MIIDFINSRLNRDFVIENAIYVVATPIGNLEDITIRAIKILDRCDIIICEDSRVTAKLLQNLQIKSKKLFIYNDYSSNDDRIKILALLQDGKSIALVSDAGTPLISDPGHKLLNFLANNNIKIIAIPGCSALTATISISRIACDNFLFLGFLPSNINNTAKILQNIKQNCTIIFFEAANRLIARLEMIANIFPDRRIAVAKELTKIYEEIIVDNAKNLLLTLQGDLGKIRGEMVVIIEKDLNKKPFADCEELSELEIKTAIIQYYHQGKFAKEITNLLFDKVEISKKELYDKVNIIISQIQN